MFYKTKKFFCLFLLFPLFFAVSGFCFYFVFEPVDAAAASAGVMTDGNCVTDKKIKEKSKKSIKPCCFAQEHDAEEAGLFIYIPVLATLKSANIQTDLYLEKIVSFSSAALTPPQKEKLASVIKRE